VILLFVVESLLGLPVLTLSPVAGFDRRARSLSPKRGFLLARLRTGRRAVCHVGCDGGIQRQGSDAGIMLFGLVGAAAFFLPGWKYFRQSRAGREK